MEKQSLKNSGREDLKKYFSNGKTPTEKHFGTLIDSMINKQDDGFSKDEENGMLLSASHQSGRYFTLYKNIDDLEPFFLIEKDEQQLPSLCINPGVTPGENGDSDSKSFFFHSQGSLGLGKRSSQQYRLDVGGFAAMEGRTGTYQRGRVPANGKWHTIVEKLDNCQALEIVARAGNQGSGRFAILHAFALSTFGKSKSKIRKTSAHFGYFWNKLNVRWKSNSTHDYELQIRTNSFYGENAEIYYNICKLWDEDLFLPEDHFY